MPTNTSTTGAEARVRSGIECLLEHDASNSGAFLGERALGLPGDVRGD